MKKEYNINHYEKAVRLGKPYEQQPGRQHGKGAGHIVSPAEKLAEAQAEAGVIPAGKPPREKSTQAQAASMIRGELKALFPKTKFRIRSSSFSMGDSVDVDWIDGPTTKQVDNVIGKYQYGHFNGMEDIYEYSNSRNDIPQSKYVMSQRQISPEVMQQAFETLKSDPKYQIAQMGNITDIDAQFPEIIRSAWTPRQYLWSELSQIDLTNGFKPYMLSPGFDQSMDFVKEAMGAGKKTEAEILDFVVQKESQYGQVNERKIEWLKENIHNAYDYLNPEVFKEANPYDYMKQPISPEAQAKVKEALTEHDTEMERMEAGFSPSVKEKLKEVRAAKPAPVKKLTTSDRIKLDKPIEIWENKQAGWTWKVWKKYQKPELEAKNEYARWFCSVSSPMTYGGYDMGDVYVKEIKENAVQTYDENSLEKAQKPRLGKPYEQQPGRKRGPGAGHIGEEIDLPGEVMDESEFLAREQLKEDLAKEAYEQKEGMRQEPSVPRYKEMTFDPSTFREVASKYKNGWEFMELMGGDETFMKIWQFGADHGWIAPTDKTHGALLQISYQILPWAQKASDEEITEFQSAIFGADEPPVEGTDVTATGAEPDPQEVLLGILDKLGSEFTYAQLEQEVLDAGLTEQDAQNTWSFIQEKYGE